MLRVALTGARVRRRVQPDPRCLQRGLCGSRMKAVTRRLHAGSAGAHGHTDVGNGPAGVRGRQSAREAPSRPENNRRKGEARSRDSTWKLKANVVMLHTSARRHIDAQRSFVQNMSMITMDILRTEKRDAIVRLGERHGASNIRVFGSVARGDNREESDIDFLVDFEKGRSLFDLIRPQAGPPGTPERDRGCGDAQQPALFAAARHGGSATLVTPCKLQIQESDLFAHPRLLPAPDETHFAPPYLRCRRMRLLNTSSRSLQSGETSFQICKEFRLPHRVAASLRT